MRVTCLIDSLGAGGAQRQLCLLANGLARRGHAVTIITYHRDEFARTQLTPDVAVLTLPPHGRLKRPGTVRRALRASRPDGVIAFLVAACIYAELATLPSRKFALIAGERDVDLHVTAWLRVRAAMHLLADHVVSNSQAQTELLRQVAPYLGSRLSTILNGMVIERFDPGFVDEARYRWSAPPRILTIGRVAPQKDGETLIRGVAEWRRTEAPGATIDWYGESGRGNAADLHHQEFLRLSALAQSLDCASALQFHEPVQHVESLYRGADVFVLASRHEGCANVLMEAMASGVPIVASRVADNALILDEGRCGMLFEAGDPAALTRALHRLAALSPQERLTMANAARVRARELFGLEPMVDGYERLLLAARTSRNNT